MEIMLSVVIILCFVVLGAVLCSYMKKLESTRIELHRQINRYQNQVCLTEDLKALLEEYKTKNRLG